MNRLAGLISETKRRSIWQALGVYLVASWGVLSVVDTLSGALGLPEWFPSVALGISIVGLPLVLATAIAQDGNRQEALGEDEAQQPAAMPGAVKVLSWSRLAVGGVLALALWGVVALAWLVMSGGRGTGDAAAVLAGVSRVQEALDGDDWIAAYHALDALPSGVPDSVEAELLASAARPIELQSEPAGASVSWRPYDDPSAPFEPIGSTPLVWQGPRGAVQFKFEAPGHVARIVGDIGLFGLGPPTVTLGRTEDNLATAVYVPPQRMSPAIVEARLSHTVPEELDAFLIDRFEVTNAQFKLFVDDGGYEQEQFWRSALDEADISEPWGDFVKRFVDQTGRPGPSTWSGGVYAEGGEEHPVTGVSWFEASAYANYAGRSLPTVYHWSVAAGLFAGQWIVPFSNLNGSEIAPVGSFQGISPLGIYDAAGNAREWLVNATGTQRYTAGGGWNDPTWLFALTQPQPPEDRSEANGFRLMTNLGSADLFSALSQPIEPIVRDFYAESPASDELYEQFLAFYNYDDVSLDPVVEAVDTLADAIREQVTFAAGYDNERMILYLFRPLESSGPLQTILNFPGSNTLNSPRFGDFGGMRDIISMLVRSGRAVAYPVLKSTFERDDDYVYRLQDLSNDHRDHVFKWRQDLGRSLDYLETRSDVDPTRFAYLGSSWGGRNAGVMLAVEPRFQAAVLNVPGLSPVATQPVVDAFNFLPRVRLPVLMLSGEYDQTYPLETSARPFFDFLGTPTELKRHFVAAGGHIIPMVDLTRETLNWLDQHLGPVRKR